MEKTIYRHMEFPSQEKMSNEVSLPIWFLSRKKRCEVRVAIVSPEYYST